MSPFAVEVEADIEVQTAEEIIRGELLFTIVITVKDGTHARKPLRVVPYYP